MNKSKPQSEPKDGEVPRYEIDIATRRGCSLLVPSKIRKIVKETLKHHSRFRAQVSVLFCGDEEMTALNHQYRQKNRPTDVLSFSQQEGPAFPENELPLLGDVVISGPTTRKNAEERGIEVQEEAERLLVHGLLHLLGYDDEDPAARHKMLEIQEQLLGKAGK